MAQLLQITTNEVISGICKALSGLYGKDVAIYKEKRETLKLPAITCYCIEYSKTMERFDRFTNVFHIIINYYPQDSLIISNKRTEMFTKAEEIMDAIRYIELPAYTKDEHGELVPTTSLGRASQMSVEEKEGFMQVYVTYTVRTKQYTENECAKTSKLEVNMDIKQ